MSTSSGASRDLIGRPLVPFFDQDENVNDKLTLEDHHQYEQMDLDARVWNKELGYFEYPSGSQQTIASATASTCRNNGVSAPIAIKNKRNSSSFKTNANTTAGPSRVQQDDLALYPNAHHGHANGYVSNGNNSLDSSQTQHFRNNSFNKSAETGSKTLLTPAMLSSSCPDSSSITRSTKAQADNAANINGPSQQHQQPVVRTTGVGGSNANGDNSRPGSKKRGSRSRSNTPVRTAKDKSTNSQSTPDSSSTSDDQTPNAPTRKGSKSRSGGANKKDLSTAVGKWAWSAFQSSPDPKHLPLPPFLGNPPELSLPSDPNAMQSGDATNGDPPDAPLHVSVSNSFMSNTTTTSGVPVAMAPPVPPPPVPPLVPPLPPCEDTQKRLDFSGEGSRERFPPPLPVDGSSLPSVEASMTQDLRRMLNIGGG